MYFHGGRYGRIIENLLAADSGTWPLNEILRRNWYNNSLATPPTIILRRLHVFQTSSLELGILEKEYFLRDYVRSVLKLHLR